MKARGESPWVACDSAFDCFDSSESNASNNCDPGRNYGASEVDLHRHAALLPEEVRLEGWLGPTVFSSEARGERLATLIELDQAMWAHRLAGALVIGTIREPDGEPRIYAAYCLEPGTGSVVLVDCHAPYRTRFVNSSIGQLGASLEELLKAWSQIAGADESVARSVLDTVLPSQLGSIDAAAIKDPGMFWPELLEGYGGDF